jgi:ABC-2 type transport system permease protein
MNKIWIVFKTEFINTITRRSFLLTLILVPLVPALILGAISLFDVDISQGQEEETTQLENEISEGYIDQAGIIKELPAWITEERLVEFNSVEEAQQAITSGEITGYYIIFEDYLESGEITYVTEDFSPMTAMETTGTLEMVIEYNLIGADQVRYETYLNPIQVEYVNLSPEDIDQDDDNMFAFYVPYGVTMLFYIVIITSASLMMNSVAKEKENRVMEILMSSIKPNQLLAGKILGLGLVGLVQMVVWLGSAFVMLRLGGTTLNIPPNLQLPPAILYWGIPFFILGYLLYAAIMAGVGALVPNIKEASQATFIIILPILIPLVLVSAIIESPDAALPTILSLIPFTAPNTIMTRIAVTQVPIWQILLSLGLLIITVILVIRAVAGMFRASLLLTGQKFKIGLYLKALLGKDLETKETTG